MSYTVGFTDNSQPGPSGPITAWAWEFGDGGTSSSQNPTHAYASTGNYSVKLTVTGTGSDGTASITSPITVVNLGVLVAAFSYSASGLAVTFTDLSIAGPSGPITGWAWNFGDTNTSTSQNPSHTYGAAGTYTVTLTVTGTSPDGTAAIPHAVTVTTASPNFVSATNFARPSFTPSRTVNFSTKAQLDAAMADMTAGDLIKYNGTGVLTISSSSGTAYSIANKTPGSLVVIDLGCSHNIWDPSKITANYVRFSASARGYDAFLFNNNSNVNVYGGDYTALHGAGLRVMGNQSYCQLLDGYVHNTGGSGGGAQPIDSHTGVPRTIDHLKMRFETTRFVMDPSLDPHADKGTGLHGLILHGNSGHMDNCTFVCYAHNPLQPGETSFGQVWPEGGGGSAIEIGTNSTGGATSQNTNVYGVLAEDMLMVCTGTNPGSNGAKQTGGNAINWWGSVPLNGNNVLWAEGNNISGQVSHGTSGGWHPGSPAISFDHGRSSNTNQAYPNNGLSSSTDPYDRRWGITYNDCT